MNEWDVENRANLGSTKQTPFEKNTHRKVIDFFMNLDHNISQILNT